MVGVAVYVTVVPLQVLAFPEMVTDGVTLVVTVTVAVARVKPVDLTQPLASVIDCKV